VTLDVSIPGGSRLVLRQSVFDLNGTLTVNGVLVDGVEQRIAQLRKRVRVYFATSDTMGTAASIAEQLGAELVKVGQPHEAEAKADLIRSLGPSATVAIGNGANDVEMLAAAAIGICIIGPEGAAQRALASADVVVTDPIHALDLLLDPVRLAATLRH
jgi:P-type E1-E2 ATPase